MTDILLPPLCQTPGGPVSRLVRKKRTQQPANHRVRCTVKNCRSRMEADRKTRWRQVRQGFVAMPQLSRVSREAAQSGQWTRKQEKRVWAAKCRDKNNFADALHPVLHLTRQAL